MWPNVDRRGGRRNRLPHVPFPAGRWTSGLHQQPRGRGPVRLYSQLFRLNTVYSARPVANISPRAKG